MPFFPQWLKNIFSFQKNKKKKSSPPEAQTPPPQQIVVLQTLGFSDLRESLHRFSLQARKDGKALEASLREADREFEMLSGKIDANIEEVTRGSNG